jgi:hypothetical protein
LHRADWEERLSIFLLVYRAFTLDTMGLTPASFMFRRQLCLPTCCLRDTLSKEQPTIDYAASFVYHRHGTAHIYIYIYIYILKLYKFYTWTIPNILLMITDLILTWIYIRIFH